MTQFYQPASGLTFNEENLRSQTGLSPDASPSTLAANGVYIINPTSDPYDPELYDTVPAYTIVGFYAEQSWVATPLPLPTAKENGSAEAKAKANEALDRSLCDCGYSTDLMTAVASQDPLARPARFQAELDEMTTISDQLDADLAAIDAATTVDEINNIVNKPTGILFTGRGSGLGPEDLNVSYYTEFNSVSMTEAETELYVPGTGITIPYGSGGPNAFDSMGNAFNPGDYLMQIRETATSAVIAEFEVPLNPAGEGVAF